MKNLKKLIEKIKLSADKTLEKYDNVCWKELKPLERYLKKGLFTAKLMSPIYGNLMVHTLSKRIREDDYLIRKIKKGFLYFRGDNLYIKILDVIKDSVKDSLD